MENSPSQSSIPEALGQAMTLLRPLSKFKARSFETSQSSHLPLLSSRPKEPLVVRLGDSMIERMITTGGSASFTEWPSSSMLSDQTAQDIGLGSPFRRRGDVFNAGVGGDKFENIAYRLTGDSNVDRPLDSLLLALAKYPIRLWVVQAGTNNLHPKRGLWESDYTVLRALLQSLLLASPDQTRIVLTGLFYRKDISDKLVDEANAGYQKLAADINMETNLSRIVYLAPAEGVDKEHHLVDHVHLTNEGYRAWSETLVPYVFSILGEE